VLIRVLYPPLSPFIGFENGASKNWRKLLDKQITSGAQFAQICWLSFKQESLKKELRKLRIRENH